MSNRETVDVKELREQLRADQADNDHQFPATCDSLEP